MNQVKSKERDCIRCGACADACPTDLLPQQLYWFSKGRQHDKVQAHNLADCIECGACSWVCPSNIPLVQYFRQAKAEIDAFSIEERRAKAAKARFEARQVRLEREKTVSQERYKQQISFQSIDKSRDIISTTISRILEKRKNCTPSLQEP